MYDDGDEWPSHVEELSRKAAEQLDKWTGHYEQGKITKREYIIIISVLYDTISGLVDKGFADLLADIDWEVRIGRRVK